MEITRILLLTE